MGIDPNHFGPYFWATIHFICLGAPDNLNDQQKAGYIDFFNNMHYVIPCGTCGDHLRENYQKIKPIEFAVKSSDELFKWSVDLHNIVNNMLSKPQMTYEDALKFWRNVPYANFVKEKNDKNEEVIKIVYKENYQGILTYIFVFIIGMLLGLLIYFLSSRI